MSTALESNGRAFQAALCRKYLPLEDAICSSAKYQVLYAGIEFCVKKERPTQLASQESRRT